MTARPVLPGMTLTPEHARQLEALVKTLSPDEALWISGYLASFARHAVQAVPSPVRPALLILYGSETGHGAGLARLAEKKAAARGLAVRNMAMDDFRLQEFHEVGQLLVIASTHGDGDPPPAAVDFYDLVMGRKAPRLEGLKFAVLGLGDSTYERFCQTGKDLDQRLEALGAQRIQGRADCDVDYEAKADAWLDEVLEQFAREVPAQAAAAAPPSLLVQDAQFDAHHPFAATVMENLILNGRGSEKETRHIELSLAGSGLAWEPGDSLGVLPENDPALVAELLAALDLRPDEPLAQEDGEIPLAEALTRRYEITALTPGFIGAYGEAAAAEPLGALAAPGKQADLRQYMAGRQVIDVVTEFPARGLDGKAFAAMLRKMQPRLYSLASSAAAYPEEAHLTVAVVRYHSHGRKRQGLASAYLADRVGSDGKVPVYVSSNKNFRLPADDSVPLIMVGAGTGVAPFRAFLQERQARGAKGRNWLFFGDRRFRTDFLYQVEWQRFLKDGLLTRMDVAFSRDQAEKVYVQHRLLEKGKEVFAWLEEGACLYVCGDASHMAPDVHRALAAIVVREGGMDAEAAEEYLKRLHKERRYQRDVY
ncbi:MAG TPA: assimilatory sulfite reductase (NADPH) flavoprotein subunit [Rhodocyclaceae bacterium]|nr:assimilatory sulfite reductase (NADPH) flavoprotein subunit [Rhodocyclaceae bacterium]